MSLYRNVSILINRAKLAIRRGNYRNAENLLKRVIVFKPHPRYIGRAWYLMAALLSALEEYQQAIECCNKSLKFNKYYYRTHLLKGICYRKLGDFDLALSSFEEASRQKYDEPRIVYQKSIASAKLGLKEKANSYFQEILDLPYNYFQKIYEENHENLENSVVHSNGITFLGVEHGCANCIQSIKLILEQEEFDTVALELDFLRLFSFFDKESEILEQPAVKKFENIDFTSSDIWTDQFYELSLLSWYAYKTFPGQEMLEAALIAEEKSIPYFLLDQNIQATQNEVKNLKTDWNRVVIQKRDLKMITKLTRICNKLGENAKILCIIGRAHLYGLYTYYKNLQRYKIKANAAPLILWEG